MSSLKYFAHARDMRIHARRMWDSARRAHANGESSGSGNSSYNWKSRRRGEAAFLHTGIERRCVLRPS